MRTAPLLVIAALAAGCPEPPPDPEPVSLIDHDLWTLLDEADDPFASHRPDPVDCPDTAWGYEFIGEDALEVRTDSCNYLSVAQPSEAAVAAGDELHVRLWHHSLSAAEDAVAHAAIAIDGEVIWEVEHAIPGDSGMDAPFWDAEADYDAGAEVVFHLHNHGNNTWNFIELSVLAEP